jgi:hypothetical protein
LRSETASIPETIFGVLPNVLQTGAGFEQGDHQFFGRARIGRRLEHHRRPWPQVAGQRARGVGNVGQVGVAFAQRSRNGDDRHVEAGADVGLIGSGVPARRQRSLQVGVGNVGREGGAVGEILGPLDIEIEADDVVAGGDGGDGQRQTDVTLADDDDALRGDCTVHCVHLNHLPSRATGTGPRRTDW